MINNRATVATILDSCAELLALTSGEDDPVKVAHRVGYVRGFLARAAVAVHADDSATLRAQAAALTGELRKAEAQHDAKHDAQHDA
jgi:hypothetical protein